MLGTLTPVSDTQAVGQRVHVMGEQIIFSNYLDLYRKLPNSGDRQYKSRT